MAAICGVGLTLFFIHLWLQPCTALPPLHSYCPIEHAQVSNNGECIVFLVVRSRPVATAEPIANSRLYPAASTCATKFFKPIRNQTDESRQIATPIQPSIKMNVKNTIFHRRKMGNETRETTHGICRAKRVRAIDKCISDAHQVS